jgi:hypothetical protein
LTASLIQKKFVKILFILLRHIFSSYIYIYFKYIIVVFTFSIFLFNKTSGQT